MFTKLLAEHDDDEGDDDKRQEVGFEFLIARGDSAELLDVIEQALDFVALLGPFLILADKIQAVRLRRDDRDDPVGVELGADDIAVIGLVHSGVLHAVTRIESFDKRFADWRVSRLPGRDSAIHRLGFRSTPGVDCRGQAAAGATQGLIAFFGAAPAAC